MKVLRSAVAAKDARNPGYLAAVEAAATGGDETYYEVPRDAYIGVVRQYSPPRTMSVTIKPRKRIAIGDAVETMLTSIGITKDRVQWLTRTKDCGCQARQKWLNQWGYEKQAQFERLVDKAAKWYGIS